MLSYNGRKIIPAPLVTISKNYNTTTAGEKLGVMYDISGDAASSVQFYLTDSVRHFIRGALYFTLQPNSDSLSPVIEFFREDILHLIETLEWQDL